ncbi:ankyrin repeat-containing protein, putative [Metarhizium acridum CQMa 102]|uniref:Ankyrin repeat-containing protein, putative n=1 Tax=Metarhizium acridum (strain CQMa 102) TaxID=655827 RepID=E9EI27_METAQ|nr:ankyrin repeat-containing protein, putative [Metarhizium acridum CQMa 102]EFY84423.1 ankyrin repeat-containing protein, putative [Metarhizium acridum CQMa 102]
MRLLNTSTLNLEEFAEGRIPQYAILSHRWGEGELSLQDVENGELIKQGVKKGGYDKVRRFAFRAQSDGFEYAWIDTCCIDKTSSAELSEAINSMYVWYYRADRCYAYLADVRSVDEICESEWFQRGWTLQELLAPAEVYFFSKNWDDLGTKETRKQEISHRTGIPFGILSGDDELETASIAQRMSWAAERKTTRVEDTAYCLMGIFRINMPLLYGEGQRAFARLQEEIIRTTHGDTSGGLLAVSPAAFENSRNIVTLGTSNSPSTVSSLGVHVELRFVGIGPRGPGLAILNCAEENGKDKPISIYVRDISLTMERFERLYSEKLEPLDMRKFRPSQISTKRLCIQRGHMLPLRKSKSVGKSDRKAEYGIYDDQTLSKLMSFGEPTALHDAARAGLEEKVWLLLTRADTKVDVKDKDGRTALMLAAEHGHAAVVLMLLKNGADIEAKYDGWTALWWAANEGREAVVSLLLERGANIEAIPGSSGTPLLWAAQSGHEAMAALLLEKGANIEMKNYYSETPLLQAAEEGHAAVVKLLLDKGADIEAKDYNSKTPLSRAAEKGHEAVVKLLLEKGANIEAKNYYNKTPLLEATRGGRAAVVKLLLEKGATMT